ncbi:MAG: ABC transporter substrate-binding protein [Anaerolineae bacterium]
MNVQKKRLTRRDFLRYAGLAAGATALSACAAPTPVVVETEKVVEKAVPQTVVVEKAVPQTVVVEKEKVVTATPVPIKKDTPIIIATPTEDAGLFLPLTHVDFPGYFLNRALLCYDFKGGTYDVVPSLAKSYEVLDNGLRYRLHLRDDAYYHGGGKYEAEHSKWYIEMEMKDDHPYHHLAVRGQSRASNVDHVEAVDKTTLDIYLKAVFPAEPDWLTSWHEWAPHNPETIKKLEKEIANHPDGLGPYKLLEWQKGSRLILEKHDKYWDPNEGLASQLIFRPVTEVQARIAALEAGEIHWMGDVPVDEALRLATNPELRVAQQKTLWVWFIHFDTRKKPLDDVRVRQALNYAVDKETLIKDVLRGAAVRSYSPLSPQFGPYYAGNVVRHYDYDPQKAKDLLAEAGYPNGFDEIDGQPAILYGYSGRMGSGKPAPMLEFIQAQWKAVGVNVKIEMSDFASFEAKRQAGDFPMAMRGWTPSSADPDGVLSQNFHKNFLPPEGRNVCWLDDAEVNTLLDTAMSTIDMPKRIQAMLDAQKRIVDLAPWLFVMHEVAFEAYNAKLQDYVAWPGGRAAGMVYAWLKV